jgi:hypothetical protein
VDLFFPSTSQSILFFCVPQLWVAGSIGAFHQSESGTQAAENATNKRNAETGNGAKQADKQWQQPKTNESTFGNIERVSRQS